jgi:hypothetical protein
LSGGWVVWCFFGFGDCWNSVDGLLLFYYVCGVGCGLSGVGGVCVVFVSLLITGF